MSLSEVAFLTLRRRILRGEFQPGEKLRMEVLQQEHSLSSSPLREALNRLVAEGLVTSDDHRGFRAAGMSSDDLEDITTCRLVVEPNALRLSIEHGNDEWEGAVVAAFHQFERVEQRRLSDETELNEEWTERHKAYHMALLSAAPSERLLGVCASLFDQAERYRRFSAMNRTRPRDTTDEHKRMVDAVLSRKVDLACAMLRDHITATTRNVVNIQQAASIS